MRLVLVGLLAVTIATAACNSTAPGGGDAQQARQLFDRQHELLRHQTWRALYATYSPTFQAACPYDQWVALTSAFTSGIQLDDLAYEDVHVSIKDDVAEFTYTRTYQGKALGAVTAASPDLYRRIDGAWYDDFDEHTTCL